MTILEKLSEIKKWCENDYRVDALFLVGSYARGMQRKDSDIDLVIITSEKDSLLDTNWTIIYGKIDRIIREEYGVCTSIRVYYLDGTEIEYGIVDNSWLSRPLDAGTRRVLMDGYILLYSSNGLTESDINALLKEE